MAWLTRSLAHPFTHPRTTHQPTRSERARALSIKVVAMRRLLERATDGQYVLYVDTDALFTRNASSVEEIVARASHDHPMASLFLDKGKGWSTHWVLLKKSEWSVAFLQRVWSLGISHYPACVGEQCAMAMALLESRWWGDQGSTATPSFTASDIKVGRSRPFSRQELGTRPCCDPLVQVTGDRGAARQAHPDHRRHIEPPPHHTMTCKAAG